MIVVTRFLFVLQIACRPLAHIDASNADQTSTTAVEGWLYMNSIKHCYRHAYD